MPTRRKPRVLQRGSILVGMTTPLTGDFLGDSPVIVELEPHEAAAGAEKTVVLPRGDRTVTIRIPPGVSDNTVLRLPGIDSSEPSAPRDVLLRVRVRPVATDVGTPWPAAVATAGAFRRSSSITAFRLSAKVPAKVASAQKAMSNIVQ